MMVAEKDPGSMNKFRGYLNPTLKSNPIEVMQAKVLLDTYKSMKDFIKNVEEHGVDKSTEKERKLYESSKIDTRNLERAISLIPDVEIRNIMEFRFIKGNILKVTVYRFSGMSERTVERKIIKGIENVAAILKIFT